MSRGIVALVFMTSLILSMVVLGGVGYYAQLGTQVDPSTHNDDVVQASEDLSGIDYNEDRSPAILQGPLAAVVPAVGILQSIKAIALNTSGVVQLLFGVPQPVGDALQTFVRIVVGLTIVYFARGLMQ